MTSKNHLPDNPAVANKLRQSRQFFYSVCVLLVLQAVYYYPMLPEQVATHFNAAGQGDAFDTRSSLIVMHLGITAFVFLVFFGIGKIIARVDPKMINIPKPEYWLTEGHINHARAAIISYMNTFAGVTMIFLMAVFQQGIEYNISGAVFSIWWVLGTFFVFVGVWIWHMFHYFYNPPQENSGH